MGSRRHRRRRVRELGARYVVFSPSETKTGHLFAASRDPREISFRRQEGWGKNEKKKSVKHLQRPARRSVRRRARAVLEPCVRSRYCRVIGESIVSKTRRKDREGALVKDRRNFRRRERDSHAYSLDPCTSRACNPTVRVKLRDFATWKYLSR